jgi:hypothetical protein
LSFLYPAFLIGAAAIAIPIVLHLLRRDVAPDVPFAAVRLLQQSAVDRVHQRRLRDLLLLAARVLALLLLAAAFARPYVQGAAPPRLRVVALDRSYSMGGLERFARARGIARSAIDAGRAGERVSLVAFDDRVDVLTPPGGAAEARAALTGVSPGFGGTRYPAVFEKARELAGGAAGRLVIVTDLQESGWEHEAAAELPANWELEVKDVGAVAANLAVTAIAVEPNRVVASIRNAGGDSRTGRARASLDGGEVAGADFTVRPNETVSVPIAWRAPETGALSVSVSDPEGLDADNTRHAVLGAPRAPRALVVTGFAQAGLYLARALETSSGRDGALDVEVATGARLSALSAADAVSKRVVVALLSTRGLDRAAREILAAHVRGGAGLLVVAGPDVDASVLAALTEWRPPLSAVEAAGRSLTLVATDLRHPIVRPFAALAANLGQVRFERSWRVAPDGWTLIARFSDGSPALLERSLGRGRVVLFASDLDRRWNDFPLHPAFVPFALETVRYVAGDRRQAREYVVADAPAGAGPGPGVFRAPDNDNQLVAVNVDIREGRLDRLSAEAFTGKVQRTGADAAVDARARETEARQSYWQYGLLVMIAALVAESFVGRS